ncbi:MAG: hypothetical protein WC470_01650 [Candidatus Paceibacterota bacterium]
MDELTAAFLVAIIVGILAIIVLSYFSFMLIWAIIFGVIIAVTIFFVLIIFFVGNSGCNIEEEDSPCF